jgi:hypothetical protein
MPEATDPPAATPETNGNADAVTAAAIAHLAAELGLTEAEIELISAEMTEFNDSCLGLGGPAESCLQAITPGWLVMLSAGGQEYELHTDETGVQVRLAEATAEEGVADAITASAVALLADQLGLTPDEIEVISAEMTEFTDSCLGLGGPAESCLQAITPGWLVMLSAGGQEYEVHTDETGVQVRVADQATESDSEAITAAAVAHLASELGVAEAEITVVSAELTEFNDGCLGLGRPDESCLQAITPGWRILLDVAGQVYEVRTDEAALQLRTAAN